MWIDLERYIWRGPDPGTGVEVEVEYYYDPGEWPYAPDEAEILSVDPDVCDDPMHDDEALIEAVVLAHR